MQQADGAQHDAVQLTMLNTDFSFITNEGDVNLLGRFKTLIRGIRFFDALVGYFYTSGFHLLCDSLDAAGDS
jgi:hypothetical protein